MPSLVALCLARAQDEVRRCAVGKKLALERLESEDRGTFQMGCEGKLAPDQGAAFHRRASQRGGKPPAGPLDASDPLPRTGQDPAVFGDDATIPLVVEANPIPIAVTAHAPAVLQGACGATRPSRIGRDEGAESG